MGFLYLLRRDKFDIARSTPYLKIPLAKSIIVNLPLVFYAMYNAFVAILSFIFIEVVKPNQGVTKEY